MTSENVASRYTMRPVVMNQMCPSISDCPHLLQVEPSFASNIIFSSTAAASSILFKDTSLPKILIVSIRVGPGRPPVRAHRKKCCTVFLEALTTSIV